MATVSFFPVANLHSRGASSSWNCLASLKHAAFAIQTLLERLARKIIEMILSKFIYMGHKTLPAKLAQERTQALIDKKGAYALACQNDQGEKIDLLYIPSPSLKKTGNAVVLALNTTYQDHHPRHYEHYLDNGADIVLWNQTARNCHQYAQDLIAVLKTVKGQSPKQKLCIKGYCAGVEPSIAAAAELKDPDISIIADRGQGNVYKLAESSTIWAKLPFVRKILREKFSCDGMQKLSSIPGRIAFVAPPPAEDQCMSYARGKRNLTHDLFNERKRDDDVLILYRGGDHWMKWNTFIHNSVNDFLRENGIIAPDYSPATAALFPPPAPASWWKRHIIPFLNKSPYDC